jgi:hypothetical protein
VLTADASEDKVEAIYILLNPKKLLAFGANVKLSRYS